VFFKRFWDLLGDSLVSKVLDAGNNCKILDLALKTDVIFSVPSRLTFDPTDFILSEKSGNGTRHGVEGLGI
jgi:hypothetical protein